MSGSLARVIYDEIQRRGYITFAHFMEIALYYPGQGYYRRSAGIFGTRGDFYTAAQLQPVFGHLIASFAVRLQGEFGPDAPFEVLELGAGLQDLQAALQRWNYRAFDWDTVPLPKAVSGLIIANEFFDAFPVHLLRRRGVGWREVLVRVADGALVFDESDDVSPALLDYARLYGSFVPEDGPIEISLAAGEWIERIGKLLTSGSVLVIDYGYEPRELVRFPEGTLLGYRRHSTTSDLLANPGARDLTAHVNFAYLRDRALEAGLEVVCESSLAKWALGIWDERELAARWDKADERWRLQWKQLIFGMGDTFRVLHLRKRKST